MIKHPALRTPSISNCPPDFLDQLLADLEEFLNRSPIKDLVTDFEVMGSYACDRAGLWSDLDINLATGDAPAQNKAILIIRENQDQWRDSVIFLKELWHKYGLRIEVALQHPSVKLIPEKMCFSLRERKIYGSNAVRARRLSLSVWDDDLGEFVPFVPGVNDPFQSEIERYQQLYGDKFLVYGETPETEYLGG